MMTRMKMRMRMMLTVSYAFLVAWSPWSLTPSRSSIPAALHNFPRCPPKKISTTFATVTTQELVVAVVVVVNHS
jgi:hypothetical protein